MKFKLVTGFAIAAKKCTELAWVLAPEPCVRIDEKHHQLFLSGDATRGNFDRTLEIEGA